eukprot:m.51332 g.51332  ORF g.51332 m.51332 type:complete len:2104 (+) comp21430_c0_seq2:202-6513(+)
MSSKADTIRSMSESGSQKGKRAFTTKVNRTTASNVREGVRISTADTPGSATYNRSQTIGSPSELQDSRKSMVSSPLPPENGLGRGPSTRNVSTRRAIVGKGFEKRFDRVNQSIAEDPYADLLLIPPDDVQVQHYEREYRTLQSPVPPEFEPENLSDHFAKQCIKFYTSPWHTFSRKFGHITKLRAAPVSSAAELSMPMYEVDLEGPREQRAKDKVGYGLSIAKVSNATVGFYKLDDVSSAPRLRAGTGTAARTRKEAMPSDSKWPRRQMQLRFATSSGPPILEIFRDSKVAKASDYKGDRVEFKLDVTFTNALANGNRLLIEVQGSSWYFVFDDSKDGSKTGDLHCASFAQSIINLQAQLSTARTEQRVLMSKQETDVANTKTDVFASIDQDCKIDNQAHHEQSVIKAARADIFGVYKGISHLPRLHYDTYDVEPIRLDAQKAPSTTSFVVTCEQLLMQLKQRDKDHANVEPFFCALAIYDVRDETKISESFFFDLNNPGEGFEFPHDADIISKSREAVFTVEYPHDEIYLVLTVEKVLQGDVHSVAETYTKQGEKIALKQAIAARAGIERKLKIGGFAQMPFVWAARQMFPNGSSLDLDKPFSSLYKQEPEKLRGNEFVKVVADYHRYSVQGAKFKPVIVPGKFRASFAHVDTESHNTVTHDLLYVKPHLDSDLTPRREVLMLPIKAKPVKTCNTAFVNYLYIWPLSVNFSNQKKASTHSKARNIMVRMQVLDSDVNPLDQEGLPVLFGKSSCRSICSSVTTTVCYHNKSPTFGSEFKLKIPANITDKHHVFFTFYHIAVDDNSKKGKQAGEIPIGFAWLPLLDIDKELLVENGEQDLMVAHAATHLARGYVGAKGEGNGQTAGPKITWIDPVKPIFHLKVQRVSSVSISDQNLSTFFEVASNPSVRDEKTSNTVKALHAVEKNEIIANFPVIMNELLRLICDTRTFNIGEIDEVSLSCVRFMVYAVEVVYKETRTSRNQLLRSYAYHVATTPTGTKSQKMLFGELTKYLSLSLNDRVPFGQHGEHTMRHSWFFFQIIAKTMAEYVSDVSSMGGSRELRFGNDFHEELENLVLNLASEMKSKQAAKDLELCKETNVSIASFLLDCLAVMDRGVVLVIMQKYLATISEGNDFLMMCRIQFVEIICHYEHYISLNLPLVPVTKDEAVAKLEGGFRKRHVLVGILLTMVKELMKYKDSSHRGHAITLLRSIIAKHDQDSRFVGQPGKLARIALLYFPVLHFVMEYWPRLFTVHLASKKNLKRVDGGFSEAETQDLLASFLWVIKNLDKEYLHHFFSGRDGAIHISRILDVLTSSLATFQYLGREKIERRRESKVPSTADVLRQFEFAYQPDSPAAKDNGTIGRRGSNSTPRKLLRKQMSTESDVDGPIMDARTATAGKKGRLHRAFTESTGTLTSTDSEAVLQAHVSKEAALVVLRVINIIGDMFGDTLRIGDGQSSRNPVMWKMWHLLTLFIATPANTAQKGQLAGQCDEVLQQYFRTLLRFVKEYDSILFHREEDYSQTLAVCLLNACNSELPSLRDRAGVMIYNLLKVNFASMSSATTMAVSSVAGESRSDRNMRASLSSIADYAQLEQAPPTPTFVSDVTSLVNRLGQVIRDTEHMQHYYDDAEMMVDLMYRVADSYSNTPQLRVIHLEKIARKHIHQENWAEAGMAICHCAAVITEHLKAELHAPLDQGCAAFANITPNLARETSPAEYKITNNLFSEQGIIHVLERAVECFEKAKLFELINRTYMLYFPLLEHQQKYKELAHMSAKMQESFLHITHVNEKKNRFLGSYFRVGFYGELFVQLNNKEYIYKEPNVTRLAEISLRLQTLYTSRFGADNVVMVKDSKTIDPSTLDKSKAYIQVTYVEPYDDGKRSGYFQKNHDIRRFMFESPFTKGGKAHGSAATQCRRRTILSVEDGVSFPYVKKRLDVIGSEDVILEPLDVAIDEMSAKVKALSGIVNASPPNMVMLQMQLQGIVSLQVNAGPMEYASVFLRSEDPNLDPKKIIILQEEFAYMLIHLDKGLDLNASLISGDQDEYHDDLKQKFITMRENLQDAIGEAGRKIMDGAHSQDAEDNNVLARISGLATPRHSIAPVNFLKAETSA